MRKLFTLALTIAFYSSGFGQEKLEKSDVSFLKFRSVGPATTSGRIADLAVDHENPNTWYVAAASGGVWKTTNAGGTFSPLFDGEGSYSIGCVAIDPSNHHTIWVGTGENNNQRSVAFGDGIYKSTDGGQSWKNMGLKNSEHIGMIAIDPNNSNIIYAAAYGPLWSEGGERGLYKSSDGGKSWNLVLEIDENTGINEVHLDPRNSNVIYATAHQRRRHVFTYVSGGEGSGIFKSTDGGKSFERIEKGLPAKKMGRIGMDISPANPDVLYAVIEGKQDAGGTFKSVNRGASWKRINTYKTSGNYYQEVFCDPTDVNKVFFMDTYCHVTRDGGTNIKRLGESKKHVDNHCMWINPTNTNNYLMGCDGGLYQTFDDGSNWTYFPNLPITQFYRVSVDQAKPFYNIYGGTQDNFSLGGPSQTKKVSGIDNYDWFVTNEGDGFESQVDPENPDIIYAQAQYGWLVRFDKKSGERVGIQPQPPVGEAYRWNWDTPLLISPHNAATLYFAANKVFKSTNYGNSWEVISEDLSRQLDRNQLKVMGELQPMDAVMKNKSTTIYGNIVALDESPHESGKLIVGTDDGLVWLKEPSGSWKKLTGFGNVPERTYVNDLLFSKHDPTTIYAVFNNHKSGDFKPYLFKSTNNGASWKAIHTTLPERGSTYVIDEDHVDPNLLFAGTEFGVFTSVDGGVNWVQLKSGLPTVAVRDIAIHQGENDLVLGTFGRGFYVLDDYSALRDIAATKSAKQAQILPIYDARFYFPYSKYGYGGAGFQGSQFFATSNPTIGANIVFYTPSVPEKLKAKRKAAEKEAGTPIIPTKAELMAEEQEEGFYDILVIKNSAGNEVRRIPMAAKKGFQQFTWDGKVQSTSSLDSKTELISKSRAAYYALPGTYSAQLFRSNNGTITSLTDAEEFRLTSLEDQSLPTNQKSKANFLAQLEKVRSRANRGNQFRDMLTKRVKAAKAAVRTTPNASFTIIEELTQIGVKLDSINILFNGNGILSSREFETTPSIMNRIGISVYSSYGNMQEVPQTHQDNLSIATNQLEKVVPELKDLHQSYQEIAKSLSDFGAPYIEGQLPFIE